MASEPSPLQCTCTPVYEIQYGGAHGPSPATAVVEAIAAVTGVDSTAMGPLADEIDLEALNNLFERGDDPTDTSTLIRFGVENWNVFVRGNGAIRVCDATQLAEPAPVFERVLE